MKTFNVTITAKVTKTIRVTADNADEASDIANSVFDVAYQEDTPENYRQEVENVEQVED